MNREQMGSAVRMDRRRFVQTAGVLAAGSVLEYSLAGCSAELNYVLPNLGPAPPPTPVPGVTYIWASKIGCALDCNLANGLNKNTGGTPTDDAPLINAAMAGASADNPITLIIDGSAMISGLYMPAGGYWSIAGLGSGTGFYTKSGCNSDAIRNAPADWNGPFNPGPPAPVTRGSNVSLSNFTLNGNQKGVSTSGSIYGNAQVWFCGINLMNLNNITIENIVVVNTPTFHFLLSNVGNVTVSGCIIQGLGPLTDGVHFDGPANDISISNCKFAVGDDSIALNCPEGYGGNIERVTVSNCTFESWSLMRLYTQYPQSGKYTIDTVNVSNCNGSLWEYAFPIGLASGSLPNSVTSFTISDCNLTSSAVLAMAENFGTIVLQNVRFTPSVSAVSWVPPQSNHDCAFLRPSPYYPGVTVVGSSLSFQNCTIVRNDNTNVAAVILQVGSEIKSVEFDGFAVQDGYFPINGLIELEESTIGQLSIDSLNSSNIEAPIHPGGFANISSVTGTGTGVLATGWEFPDAVMANEVPYVSATTGQPSIKVNGVVEPYSPS